MIIQMSRKEGVTYSREGTQISVPDLGPLAHWSQHFEGLLVGHSYIAVIMRDGVEVTSSLEVQAEDTAQAMQFEFPTPFVHDGRMFGVRYCRLTANGWSPVEVTGVRNFPDGEWEPL